MSIVTSSHDNVMSRDVSAPLSAVFTLFICSSEALPCCVVGDVEEGGLFLFAEEDEGGMICCCVAWSVACGCGLLCGLLFDEGRAVVEEAGKRLTEFDDPLTMGGLVFTVLGDKSDVCTGLMLGLFLALPVLLRGLRMLTARTWLSVPFTISMNWRHLSMKSRLGLRSRMPG